jgi:hypothetical protein
MEAMLEVGRYALEGVEVLLAVGTASLLVLGMLGMRHAGSADQGEAQQPH